MYYFAYGSNMNHAQRMLVRCPGARFISPARLDGYRFVFDGVSTAPGDEKKAAVANLVPDTQAHVWGALWDITKEHVVTLDYYEQVPTSYQRLDDVAVTDSAGTVYKPVIVYLRPAQVLGMPSDEYRALIINGAHESGLPADYIAKLEQA